MSLLRLTIATLLAALLCITPAYSAPIIDDGAVGTVWTFENVTWIENLAVRQTGGVLCTSINRAAVYLVDPFEHTACVVHQFDPTEGVLGIAEVETDVFVVGTSNISLTTSTASPGSARLFKIDMAAWDLGQVDAVQLIVNPTDVGLPDGIASLPNDKGVVLLADAAKGVIWRVDVSTGEYDVAISDDLFLVSNPLIPLGVDGIHILDDVLYFTNLGLNLLAKVPISANGTATGPIQNITNQLPFVDDFAVAADGTVYAAGDNTLWRVSPDGGVETFAGGEKDLTLEGVTSAQFGRTRDDAGVLYLGTNGGLLSAVDGVLHGGQLLALNVGV